MAKKIQESYRCELYQAGHEVHHIQARPSYGNRIGRGR